ncbi:hypothetical protein JW826_00245 [Candidatus Woesearchaeota archaeon]|nr:hypothetical protein [Candidatus Woesearchaeota archaeon]
MVPSSSFSSSAGASFLACMSAMIFLKAFIWFSDNLPYLMQFILMLRRKLLSLYISSGMSSSFFISGSAISPSMLFFSHS